MQPLKRVTIDRKGTKQIKIPPPDPSARPIRVDKRTVVYAKSDRSEKDVIESWYGRA